MDKIIPSFLKFKTSAPAPAVVTNNSHTNSGIPTGVKKTAGPLINKIPTVAAPAPVPIALPTKPAVRVVEVVSVDNSDSEVEEGDNDNDEEAENIDPAAAAAQSTKMVTEQVVSTAVKEVVVTAAVAGSPVREGEAQYQIDEQ